MSLAVLPLNSTANSIRPVISLRQCRIFFLRNAVERWRRDWPFRYRRSKILTERIALEMQFWEPAKRHTTWSRIMFLFGLIYETWLDGLNYRNLNSPKAAVFKCPNGRLRSETGSQTNISPSSIMLLASSERRTIERNYNSLVNPCIESLVNKGGQTPTSNMLPI
jgi:hypothetical protein